jgi:hypothetical protein
MKRTVLMSTAALLFGATTVAGAATLDLNLNDDAVRGEFSTALSNLFTSDTEGQFQLGALYTDDDSIDLTQLHAGLLATGDTGAQDVQFKAGVGIRAQYLDSAVDDGGGFALGGQFDLRFRGFERLGLMGYLWYTPKVLSFGDIEDQTEYALDADYQILRNASIYVGYRQLRVDPDSGHAYDADKSGHLGFRFHF